MALVGRTASFKSDSWNWDLGVVGGKSALLSYRKQQPGRGGSALLSQLGYIGGTGGR